MKNKQIIGVDVSKNSLDVFILKANHYYQVENNPVGFVYLLQEATKVLSISKNHLHFCFENTGCYSKQLSVFLQDAGIAVSLSAILRRSFSAMFI